METQSGDKTLLFYPGGGEPWYIKDENRGVDQSHRMWPLYEEECLDLGEGAMCTGRRSHGCTCFGGWGWGTVLSIALLWTKVQRCPELGWPQGTVSHMVLLERKKPGYSYGRRSGPLVSSNAVSTNSSWSWGSTEGRWGHIKTLCRNTNSEPPWGTVQRSVHLQPCQEESGLTTRSKGPYPSEILIFCLKLCLRASWVNSTRIWDV